MFTMKIYKSMNQVLNSKKGDKSTKKQNLILNKLDKSVWKNNLKDK